MRPGRVPRRVRLRARVRPAGDRELAVSVEQPTDVDQRHGDHAPESSYSTCGPPGWQRARGRSLVTGDAQIQHVAAFVVLVLLEGNAGDRDAHCCFSRGSLSCARTVTIHAGTSLKLRPRAASDRDRGGSAGRSAHVPGEGLPHDGRGTATVERMRSRCSSSQPRCPRARCRCEPASKTTSRPSRSLVRATGGSVTRPPRPRGRRKCALKRSASSLADRAWR